MTKAALRLARRALATVLTSTTRRFDSPTITPVPSTDPRWMLQHEGFVAQARTERIDLLFLGDSITDGWREAGANVWDTYYVPRHAANFGISGDQTQHLLWRIQHGELEGLAPKVVVLMIGTNNSKFDAASEIAEGVEKIVAEIRLRCPTAKVLLMAILPRKRPTDKRTQMATINRVNLRISRLADGHMVRFLNINDRFLGPDGTVPIEIMPNFVTPNQKGYAIWAEAMEPTLAGMLREP
jgi:lysophospholipase L1-like esterase